MAEHYLQQELFQLLRDDNEVFNFLQSSVLDGLWYWDLKHPENEWMSPEFWQLLGYAPDEKKHQAIEWQTLINQDDLQLCLRSYDSHCQDPTHPFDEVVRYTHKNGSDIWVRCRGIILRDEHGKPHRMLGAHHDITDLKLAELRLLEQNKKLEKLAQQDYLTGCLNRLAFDQQLEVSLKLARRKATAVSLIILDIDHFKRVSDEFGHLNGDCILKEVAEVLNNTARTTDIIARYGGEEFAFIVFDQHAGSIHAAERIRLAIAHHNWSLADITISLGIATFQPNEYEDEADIKQQVESIISQADKALYKAKSNGRNRSEHYDHM